jgi:hypothetical protein
MLRPRTDRALLTSIALWALTMLLLPFCIAWALMVLVDNDGDF